MTSSISIISKLSNSFIVKGIQADPFVRKLTSFLSMKQLIYNDGYGAVKPPKIATTPKAAKETQESQPAQCAQPKVFNIDNSIFDTFQKDEDTVLYVIYLNRPFDQDTLVKLNRAASFSIMADGAANRFHDNHKKQSLENEIIPDALVGDFDSIRPDVLTYYKKKGVNVHQVHSQDDTDLEKCLKFLYHKIHGEQPQNKAKHVKVVITGGFGGRMDHTMNNIHILHKFAEEYDQHSNLSIHLIDNNSIGTCILPGKTQYKRAKVFEKTQGCGMFPLLGQKASVTTNGLKWDVDANNALSFKKFVSSSNEMVNDVVEFETDEIIFWVTANCIHKEHIDE